MGISQTGSFDIYLALTEAGLDRTVRAAFLERTAPYGLPWPVAADFGDAGAEFRFHAPTAKIRPADFVNIDVDINGMIGIDLPFSHSIIQGNVTVNVLGTPITVTLDAPRIRGTLQVAIPVLPGGVFGPDVSLAEVALSLADDDPDPEFDDKTSAEKLPGYVVVLIASEMTNRLRNGDFGDISDLLTGSALDGMGGLGICPVEPVAAALPTVPVVRAPRLDRLVCVDGEERDTALLIKGKASAIAADAGTSTDSAQGSLAWLGTAAEIGAAISNRFLMQELLPSALLPALVGVDRAAVEETAAADIELQIEAGELAEEDRRDATEAAVDAAIGAAVAPFFTFPMTQIAPVPMTLPLPTIADMVTQGAEAQPAVLTGPNAQLTGSSFEVFPGGGPSSIRCVLDIAISEPEAYTASIVLDVGFAARDGRLQVEAAVDSVDVTLPGLPDGFASAFLNVVWDPILNLLVDAFGEPGAASAADAAIGASFDTSAVGRELRHLIYVQDAVLDDLGISGLLRLQQDFTGSDRLRAPLVEQRCLHDSIGGETGLAGSGIVLSLSDDAEGAVTLENDVVTPSDGVEITVLGYRTTTQAANLGLADILAPGRSWSLEPVPLEPPWVVGAAFRNVRLVLGLRDGAGRHGRLIVWIDPVGRMQGRLVRYRRVLPQLVIRERPAGPPLPQNPPQIFGWDPSFRAMYVDPAEVPEGSVVTGHTVPGGWQEPVEVPRLVGRGGGTFGSVMVGVHEVASRIDGALLAVPTMLAAPVGNVRWTVRDADGTEHDLPAGETLVDLGTHDSAVVACAVAPDAPHICRVLGDEGADVDAEFIARIDHGYLPGGGANTLESRRRIKVSGRVPKPFGFKQWLDRFEHAMAFAAKLGRDPDPVGPRIQPGDGLIRPVGDGPDARRNAARIVETDGPSRFGQTTRRAVRALPQDAVARSESDPENLTKTAVLTRMRELAGRAPEPLQAAVQQAIRKAETDLPSTDDMLRRAAKRRGDSQRNRRR